MGELVVRDILRERSERGHPVGELATLQCDDVSADYLDEHGRVVNTAARGRTGGASGGALSGT